MGAHAPTAFVWLAAADAEPVAPAPAVTPAPHDADRFAAAPGDTGFILIPHPVTVIVTPAAPKRPARVFLGGSFVFPTDRGDVTINVVRPLRALAEVARRAEGRDSERGSRADGAGRASTSGTTERAPAPAEGDGRAGAPSGGGAGAAGSGGTSVTTASTATAALVRPSRRGTPLVGTLGPPRAVDGARRERPG